MAWRRRTSRGALWVHQLQLTIADFVEEVHNTHHPIGAALYYEQQRKEAKRYSREFWKRRPQKYLDYFERVLERSGGPWLLGRRISYADLSLFQVVEGLRYAFPKANAAAGKEIPGVVAVHDAVSAAAADRRIFKLATAHTVQRVRNFPALPGA